MNIEVNFNNLTKEEQEQLNALVEKANKPKSKVWKPEIGERFYYIMSNDTTIDYFAWRGDATDEAHYTIGNCFKTREEAEFALERLKVIAEMKRYIAEHDDVKLDWNDCEQSKYYLVYNHYTVFIDCLSSSAIQSVERGLCASKGSILSDMLGKIGEDRIKKYYFGVE